MVEISVILTLSTMGQGKHHACVSQFTVLDMSTTTD